MQQITLDSGVVASWRERHVIVVQEEVSCHPDTILEAPCQLAELRLSQPVKVGAFTYSHSALNDVILSIGRYCSIAHGVSFRRFEHPTSWLTTSAVAFHSRFEPWAHLDVAERPLPPQPRTVIGNDVWIGEGAYIRPGVAIGDGAIVGTRTVVTRDVPPYSVYCGNPGRVVKMRFDPDLIERLIALQWWQYGFGDLAGIDVQDASKAVSQIEDLIVAGKLKPYNPDVVRP